MVTDLMGKIEMVPLISITPKEGKKKKKNSLR